jgi:hypothetical protein
MRQFFLRSVFRALVEIRQGWMQTEHQKHASSLVSANSAEALSKYVRIKAAFYEVSKKERCFA